jgi:hypothetical protein
MGKNIKNITSLIILPFLILVYALKGGWREWSRAEFPVDDFFTHPGPGSKPEPAAAMTSCDFN